jgi:hypothetical protein
MLDPCAHNEPGIASIVRTHGDKRAQLGFSGNVKNAPAVIRKARLVQVFSKRGKLGLQIGDLVAQLSNFRNQGLEAFIG